MAMAATACPFSRAFVEYVWLPNSIVATSFSRRYLPSESVYNDVPEFFFTNQQTLGFQRVLEGYRASKWGSPDCPGGYLYVLAFNGGDYLLWTDPPDG